MLLNILQLLLILQYCKWLKIDFHTLSFFIFLYIKYLHLVLCELITSPQLVQFGFFYVFKPYNLKIKQCFYILQLFFYFDQTIQNILNIHPKVLYLRVSFHLTYYNLLNNFLALPYTYLVLYLF